MLLFALPRMAAGWHDEGHVYIALAAVESSSDGGEGEGEGGQGGEGGEGMPSFFCDGAEVIAHVAIDPDLFRNRGTPQLRAAEDGEHYLDLELLRGRELPRTRPAYVKLAEELGVDPFEAGFLPYAVTEWTQRLTLAFAEVRADPEDEAAKAKALVYAGLLAHYAADLHQPLHTSVHYDGRADANGKSPRSGIHRRVDALPTKMTYNELFKELLPEAEGGAGVEDVWGYVMSQLAASHAELDRVYELEARLGDAEELNLEDDAVRRFTRERVRAGAVFLAELYRSAWENSAAVKLEPWLDRRGLRGDFDRDKVPPQPRMGAVKE